MNTITRVLIATILISGLSVVIGMALVLDTVRDDSRAAAEAIEAEAKRDAAELAQIIRVQELLRSSFRNHRAATEDLGVRILSFVRGIAERAGIDTRGLGRVRTVTIPGPGEHHHHVHTETERVHHHHEHPDEPKCDNAATQAAEDNGGPECR